MILILLLLNFIYTSAYPTFLIHGIASNTNELSDLYNYLTYYNITTYNIEIGNGKIDSIFMDMNKQCDIFSNKVNNIITQNKNTKVNIIGISQGGLTARCFVEKYSNNNINTLMTIGTPHMGIYDKNNNIKSLQYWKNPFNYNDYLTKNKYLVYLNNENTINNVYKKNLININNFIVIWSSIDKVIKPLESAKFEFYNSTLAKDKNELSIISLNNSDIYNKDYIGLKELNNKLIISKYDCEHDKFKTYDCFVNIFNDKIKYL
jgi:palmitoyl-protein thioesterase